MHGSIRTPALGGYPRVNRILDVPSSLCAVRRSASTHSWNATNPRLCNPTIDIVGRVRRRRTTEGSPGRKPGGYAGTTRAQSPPGNRNPMSHSICVRAGGRTPRRPIHEPSGVNKWTPILRPSRVIRILGVAISPVFFVPSAIRRTRMLVAHAYHGLPPVATVFRPPFQPAFGGFSGGHAIRCLRSSLLYPDLPEHSRLNPNARLRRTRVSRSLLVNDAQQGRKHEQRRQQTTCKTEYNQRAQSRVGGHL